MQTIEAKVQIRDDRTLQIQLPAGVAAGEYEVVLVLNRFSQAAAPPDQTAIQKIQALLRPSVEPGHSLADELIQDRREAAKNE